MRRTMRRPQQQGMALLLVLVVLAITLLAGMGVLKAVQTGNSVAGNFSFRQVALQASDRAVSDALDEIANRVAGGAGNTAVAHRYLAVIEGTVDALGVPSSIDWTGVSCSDEKGALIADCTLDDGGFRVQYVVERRCSASPDLANIADIRARCEHEPSAASVSAATTALRYRVLVRVRGPRGTDSWFEAVVSGPATT